MKVFNAYCTLRYNLGRSFVLICFSEGILNFLFKPEFLIINTVLSNQRLSKSVVCLKVQLRRGIQTTVQTTGY